MNLVRKTVKSRVLYGLMTIMAFSALSTEAHAISLRFKSKIFSSGPMIYACNAGVANQVSQNTCFFGGNPANGSCTPLSCSAAKENCNTDCVCSTTLGGKYPGDIRVRNVPYMTVADNHAAPLTQTKAGGSAFKSIFTGAQAWDHRIYDLATYFPQELYNGEYFFDVCYRGSQIPGTDGFFQVTTQASAIPFEVINSNGFNSLDNNRSDLDFNPLGTVYTTKSGLVVQSFVSCGQTQAQADFSVDSNNLPTGSTGGWYNKSPINQPLNSSVITNGLNGSTSPRFCKIRYVIRETAYLNLLSPHRDHKAEGAEVCTLTTVQDPPADEME